MLMMIMDINVTGAAKMDKVGTQNCDWILENRPNCYTRPIQF